MKNQITDTQSLFAFITNQMEGLAKNEVAVDVAAAQAKLAKAAIHLLVYEVNRARILFEIEQAGNSEVEFRDLQIKRLLKSDPMKELSNIPEMDMTK